MTDLAPFSFRHSVEVRFQDVDAYGHAHHSRALIYFEEARSAYWRDVAGVGRGGATGYVLTEVAVQYHERISYPLTVDVGVRVTQIGRKHFVMEYEARSDDGRLLISGRTVQVMFDYETRKSIPLPQEIRAAIEAWEGPLLPDAS